MQQSLKKLTLRSGFWAIIIIVVVLLSGIIAAGYGLPENNRFGSAVRGILPLPLLVLDGRNIITTKELTSNIRSVRRFYETQDLSKYGIRVDFSTDDGQKRLLIRKKEILNKMLEDKEIMILAREQGIVVTAEMAHDGVRRKLEEYGGTAEEIGANLGKLYGWTLTDFEQKIVTPDLYQELLTQHFEKNTKDRERAQAQIQAAAQALRNGASFADVVSRYSDGRTKAQGGEMGWFAIQNLSTSLQKSVANQKKDVPGEVAESELGFHIIVVEETKQEGKTTLYRLKEVFVKKRNVADWLIERMKASPPRILSREYVWDEESARIEFRDPDLRQFERSLLENTSQESKLFL